MYRKQIIFSSTLILFLLYTTSKARLQDEKSNEDSRQQKIFSLFNIVTFRNLPCVSNSGTTGTTGRNRNGTCFTNTECSSKGGQASGSCASGFGICCLFVVSTTGATIEQNCTYIQNPGFPSTLSDSTSLSYTVKKCSCDVCSLRLDFETLTILGPATTGEADTTGAPAPGHLCQDSFTVTGTSGLTSPVICGQNSGQHVYMDIGTGCENTGKIDLAFGTAASTSRQFEIKVTQVECTSRSRPTASGCLQYHTGTTGRIQMFNYQADGQHLANQRYDICIRQEEGFCCVQYSLCEADSWEIDGNMDTQDKSYTSMCTTDYIEIAGVSTTCGGPTQATTLCGKFVCGASECIANAPFCDCSAPFTIGVVTNADADAAATVDATAAAQRGVCLEYKQIAC